MTMLERYWPTHQEINRCIKAEAESASEAVLLAAHQATPLAVRNAGASNESEVAATEHDFLEAFLTDDLPEGFLLMPIIGASGAGKSHMIRWLNANLKRDPRAHGMHIIRIPKSANLRAVVELIIEPLSGDAKYATARTELKRAVADVSSKDGATRFATELRIALRKKAEELSDLLKNNPDARRDRDLRTHLQHALRLPDFLGDPELIDHFESKVLAPIIERAISGRREDEGDNLPQFSSDDLLLPQHLMDKLGKSAQSVRTYCQTILNSRDGQGREIAAKVLNSVVDEAIHNVFQLDKVTGGITLEEIIQRIRELLFEDGQELVLLVEDFVALSGIQEVLLNVCIQEAVRDGKQVRARMRTALALTDGYLVHHETIQTRAKREWVIRSNLDSPDAILDKATELVGAYLNAARWGEEELKRRFSSIRTDSEEELTSWVRVFDDPDKTPEESDILEAFGSSDQDVPLFPFNRFAIHSLVKRNLSKGGVLQFNPRSVINFILRNLLLQRQLFLRGAFPPPGFSGANASAEIAAWLSRSVAIQEERERLVSLLVHWGNDPVKAEDAVSLPSGLFQAFRLPTPEMLGVEAPKIPPPGKVPMGLKTPPPQPTTTVAENPQIEIWRKRLDDWSGGVELGQNDANKLRSILMDSIKRGVDWNAQRMADRWPKSLLIHIPNARGNDKVAKITLYQLAEEHSDPTGQLRKTLLATIRYDLVGKSWDYQGGDEDSALYANLIDVLRCELMQKLDQEREREIAPLGQILLVQARILGLAGKQVSSPKALTLALFQTAPEVHFAAFPDKSPEARWQELRREAAMQRLGIQKVLLDRIGCFQGAGQIAFAIDAELLHSRFGGSEELPQLLLETELASARGHITDLKPARLKPRIEALINLLNGFYRKMLEELGESLEKQMLLETFGQLQQEVEEAGVWPDEPDFRSSNMKQITEAFRLSSVKEFLDTVSPLWSADAEPSLDDQLIALGRIDLGVVDVISIFVSRVTGFVDAVKRQVDIKEHSVEGVDPVGDAEALDKELSAVERSLDCLKNSEACQ